MRLSGSMTRKRLSEVDQVLNILLLEDQPAISDIMNEIINQMNVPTNVERASTLKEARKLIREKHLHGMVADLTLGDGQSLDLIAELHEQGIDIPIVLVSGFLSSTKLQQARQLGVDEVLHKPFHPDTLLAVLNKLFCAADSGLKDNSSSVVLQDKLLSELFAMDRNLGLFSRILNEIPRRSDVGSICSSTLLLAMDMVHATSGFVCLFERSKQQLVMISHKSGQVDGTLATTQAQCELSHTPFAPLLLEGAKFLFWSDCETVCWPGVTADQYIALPMRLQGKPVGVICLMGCSIDGALPDQYLYLLEPLISQLDTLLDNSAVHAALDASMKETLIALVRTLEARDRYTKDHSARVSEMAVRFATDMGLSDDDISLVRIGGLLHDIGKVGVPDAVLLKPGRYTTKEFAIMKAHPAIGDAILKHMDSLARERQVIRFHHERIDGCGYPDKLKGEDIPLVARIVCVADSIDAMTTHRVYRQARPLSFCLEQLKQNSGTQFDAQVVEVAIAAIEAGHISTQATSEDDGGDVLPAFLPAFANS